MTWFDVAFLIAISALIVAIVLAVVALVRGQGARARSIAARTAVAIGVYFAILFVTSIASPRRILSPGTPQCSDDWCITVDSIRRDTRERDAAYVVSFALSSRARGAPQRERFVVSYLETVDGRRIDAVPQSATVPFDTVLEPGQTIIATRRFVVPLDTRPRGVVVARDGGFNFPRCCIIGEDNSLLHRHALTPIGARDTIGVPPVLLYSGAGTSPNDVAAVEAILKLAALEYAKADAGQLNSMSASRLRAYRLIIVPGGDFIAMANALSPATTTTIHDAVQSGVRYLGICGGAFLAADARYNSLRLTPGVRFGFYSAERRGVRKAVVLLDVAGASPIEHYWEDGPALSGWGDVVARYPDGAPAVVEGSFGKGWVVLAGVHPEAPESWRRGLSFSGPASVANAYAKTLIDAALNGTALPHY